MNNEQMLAALVTLPAPDMMTATKIDDPLGSGSYFRADNVVRMLAEERETSERLRAALCKDFNAAINFALLQGLSGIEFLEAWREGDWESINREWPEFKTPNVEVTGPKAALSPKASGY